MISGQNNKPSDQNVVEDLTRSVTQLGDRIVELLPAQVASHRGPSRRSES